MRIKIAGHDHEILGFDQEHRPNLMGRYEPDNNIIRIKEGMALSAKKETLTHEALHAMLTHSGVSVDEDGKVEMEEVVVAVASGLFQLGLSEVLWNQQEDK